MGCDIHLFVERRNEYGNWVRALPGDVGYIAPDFRPGRWAFDTPHYGRAYKWYRSRNYALFAMLADVRNYWGIVPIAPLRGRPSDLSLQVRSIYSAWEDGDPAEQYKAMPDGEVSPGDHSASWLTLAELQNPAYWARQVDFGNGDTATYAEAAGEFYAELLPALAGLGCPSNVRIVFDFDN